MLISASNALTIKQNKIDPPSPPVNATLPLESIIEQGPSTCKRCKKDSSSSDSDCFKKFQSKKECKKECKKCDAPPCCDEQAAITLSKVLDIDRDVDDLEHDLCDVKSTVRSNNELLKDVLH